MPRLVKVVSIKSVLQPTRVRISSLLSGIYPIGREENCFFAEHTAPHVTTPLFPLQSEYDSWQAGNILGSKDAAQLNAFGKDLTKRYQDNVLRHARNGGFLDSCFHHCGEWDQIVINGDNSGTVGFSGLTVELLRSCFPKMVQFSSWYIHSIKGLSLWSMLPPLIN